jgi:hypothetical protein
MLSVQRMVFRWHLGLFYRARRKAAPECVAISTTIFTLVPVPDSSRETSRRDGERLVPRPPLSSTQCTFAAHCPRHPSDWNDPGAQALAGIEQEAGRGRAVTRTAVPSVESAVQALPEQRAAICRSRDVERWAL